MAKHKTAMAEKTAKISSLLTEIREAKKKITRLENSLTLAKTKCDVSCQVNAVALKMIAEDSASAKQFMTSPTITSIALLQLRMIRGIDGLFPGPSPKRRKRC